MPFETLKQKVPTRWSSCLRVVISIRTIEIRIEQMLFFGQSKRDSALSDVEMTDLIQPIKFLDLFGEANSILEAIPLHTLL